MTDCANFSWLPAGLLSPAARTPTSAGSWNTRRLSVFPLMPARTIRCLQTCCRISVGFRSPRTSRVIPTFLQPVAPAPAPSKVLTIRLDILPAASSWHIPPMSFPNPSRSHCSAQVSPVRLLCVVARRRKPDRFQSIKRKRRLRAPVLFALSGASPGEGRKRGTQKRLVTPSMATANEVRVFIK
jgi:hypothetical protein